MSLTCSIIGHDYGEPEIEREREERGSEMVVTVTELERCERCGKTTVISENTEVTSAAPSGRGHDPDGSAESDAAPAEPEGPTAGARDDPHAEAEAAEPDATAEGDGPIETDVDPEIDDGVILDDEPMEERGRGEWPRADDVRYGEDLTDRRGRWPDVEGDDEGFDAVAGGGPAEVNFGGGLTPQADRSEGDGDEGVIEAGPDSRRSTDAGAGFVRAGSAPAPDRPIDEGETEFYCPNCGATDVGERPSLRAGDICPECRRGYIAER